MPVVEVVGLIRQAGELVGLAGPVAGEQVEIMVAAVIQDQVIPAVVVVVVEEVLEVTSLMGAMAAPVS